MNYTHNQKNAADRTDLGFYHSATQFRYDSWHRLVEYANKLDRQTQEGQKQEGQKQESLAKKAESLLSTLQTLEDYTAFPSSEDFELLW